MKEEYTRISVPLAAVLCLLAFALGLKVGHIFAAPPARTEAEPQGIAWMHLDPQTMHVLTTTEF